MARKSRAVTPKNTPNRGKAAKTPHLRVVDEHAGPEPVRLKCNRITAKGTQCSRWAAEGSKLCPGHLRPAGRPAIELTDELVETICETVRLGGYMETAALAAGVSKQTLYTWRDRGHPEREGYDPKADKRYTEFREKLEEARATAEAAAVIAVRKAMPTEWRAAAWWLERVFPERYAGPRGRSGAVHPADFAAGESSGPPVDEIVDDQVGPDGRAL